MKKLMMTALAAIAAAMTGCTSTSAEWGGERVITGADGLPLVANDGTVQKAKEPVRLSSWRHWIDTHVDTAKLDVEKDRIEFTMNGYKAEPSEARRAAAAWRGTPPTRRSATRSPSTSPRAATPRRRRSPARTATAQSPTAP